VQRLFGTLVSIEARLQSSLAECGSMVDFEQASEEELCEMREMRTRAAIVAMQCMAIMQRYFGALKPSMMRRVLAAAWRPREAGAADASANALVPAIARLFVPRLWVSFTVLWLIGIVSALSIFFDRFEAGSRQEWLACAAGSLMLPVIVCIGASLNAKTVRALLKEFQTIYLLVNTLGFGCLLLFLFRDHPAKMVAFGLWLPSFLLAGFVDASMEAIRLLISRVFFTLNVSTLLLLILALISFKLGAFTDYTFEVRTFVFVASSLVCSTITTLVVFGSKNLGLSFHRPGSLVVLISDVGCLFLDADSLAVLKASYSLQGQSLGKYAPNKTVADELKKHKKSIVAAAGELVPRPLPLGAAVNAVAPAPAMEPADEAWESGATQHAATCPDMVAEEEESLERDLGDSLVGTSSRPGTVTAVELSGAASCPPFDMRAGLCCG
jgi:hypothetical protein